MTVDTCYTINMWYTDITLERHNFPEIKRLFFEMGEKAIYSCILDYTTGQ